jgi:TatD DNase family protein
MIDVHCHLEQKDFDKDREEVIEKCKKKLKAVVTSCVSPDDFELSIEIAKKYKDFVFLCVGIHPEEIKEIAEKEKDEFLEIIKKNKDYIVGFGEVGLDFYWIKEEKFREKQKQWFVEFIDFAKEIKKPLIIHSREAYEDTIKILEKEDAKKVLLHLFGGLHLIKRVYKNGWYVSIGPVVIVSKKHAKIVNEMPIEFLLTETDAPWNSPEFFLKRERVRNDPTSVKFVVEKIAEIKNISFEEADRITTKNAIKFFDIPK